MCIWTSDTYLLVFSLYRATPVSKRSPSLCQVGRNVRSRSDRKYWPETIYKDEGFYQRGYGQVCTRVIKTHLAVTCEKLNCLR